MKLQQTYKNYLNLEKIEHAAATRELTDKMLPILKRNDKQICKRYTFKTISN